MDEQTIDGIISDLAPRLSTIEREAITARISLERRRTIERCIATVREFDGLNLDMIAAALRTLDA